MEFRTLLPGAFCVLLCAGGCGTRVEPDPDGREPDARAAWLETLEPPLEPADLERVVALTRDENPLPRMKALEVLGRTGDPGNLKHVQPAFDDPARNVRREACRSAALLGNPAVIPALARVAGSRREDNWVRVDAVEALVVFGPRQDVLRALIDVLNDGGGNRPRLPDQLIGERTVIHAAHGGLKGLTGKQDLSDDRIAWLDWVRAKYGE